jgi:predicted nucleic acid-binding protein
VSLVLDGSATLAWLYPEETTPAILKVFDQVVHHGAIVPDLWRIEVANALTMGIRRKRITAKERGELLSDLALLPILVDDETRKSVWSKSLELADAHSLSVYDAVYLELALRRALPLATLDSDLRRAAAIEGVSLLGV